MAVWDESGNRMHIMMKTDYDGTLHTKHYNCDIPKHIQNIQYRTTQCNRLQ